MERWRGAFPSVAPSDYRTLVLLHRTGQGGQRETESRAAFGRMVQSLCDDRLHVFVFDDAHAIDRVTLDAILAIAGRAMDRDASSPPVSSGGTYGSRVHAERRERRRRDRTTGRSRHSPRRSRPEQPSAPIQESRRRCRTAHTRSAAASTSGASRCSSSSARATRPQAARCGNSRSEMSFPEVDIAPRAR